MPLRTYHGLSHKLLQGSKKPWTFSGMKSTHGLHFFPIYLWVYAS